MPTDTAIVPWAWWVTLVRSRGGVLRPVPTMYMYMYMYEYQYYQVVPTSPAQYFTVVLLPQFRYSCPCI